jgi:hypothetical protein
MAETSRNPSGSGLAEGPVGAAQEAAKGAAQKLTEGASYVQGKLGVVDDTVRDYTGKPLGEWTEDIKSLMRERPMMGAALMIGIGYAVAKFLRR